MREAHAALERACGVRLAPHPDRDVSGGCISHCVRWPLAGGDAALFVKLADADRLAMFEAEAAGLEELAAARAVRVPAVRGCGVAGDVGFLALEWLDLRPAGEAQGARLGSALAQLHARTAGRCGWHRDNTIGSTPQENAPDEDWTRFFRERRLAPQLVRAGRGSHGELQALGERLLPRVAQLLEGHRPQASLLHGDLWGGNFAADPYGEPVLFDPAVYYGDREADLAMTRLFGGFGAGFYERYVGAWPLPAGHEVRAELYNLYHVLNHVNLFGGQYVGQAARLIGRLLSHCGE